jgi:hypothetical protein
MHNFRRYQPPWFRWLMVAWLGWAGGGCADNAPKIQPPAHPTPLPNPGERLAPESTGGTRDPGASDSTSERLTPRTAR